ncbi:MAG: helix-turn-helix transcriptional regulator [Treponema sp.]|jgi:transcriptional regulator with XRE-family HTH domain|nr:helix-turn-helix transcriptional regulator [Treponema sp.]
MDYSARSPALQRLSRSEGKWISYQMKLRGLTQKGVAAKAGKARDTVSNVLNGRISSAAVYSALQELLGYKSMAEMLAAARSAA